MPKLIKEETVIENDWKLIEKDADIKTLDAIEKGQFIIPVKLWLENKEQLNQYRENFGIWFDSDENPELLDEDANNFPLIALNFPVFRDGRSFSHAAILRQQLNYKGDMRAIGDVRRDQASYMLSCGFSSFLIPDDVNEDLVLAGLHDFSENYQSTVAKPTPLFRRR